MNTDILRTNVIMIRDIYRNVWVNCPTVNYTRTLTEEIYNYTYFNPLLF